MVSFESNMVDLGLSLGGTPKKPLTYLDKTQKMVNRDLEFCMGLGRSQEQRRRDSSSSDSPVQLDLLPFSPVQRNQPPSQSQLRFPWLSQNLLSEPDSSRRGVDVNRRLPVAAAVAEEGEDGASLSSPKSTVSSFQKNLSSIHTSGRGKRDLETSNPNEFEIDQRGGSSRGSDEEENGSLRKKLRLSKDQSAFLEESFKEHSTLNPKQKLALAKELNLRPRQVEVWFQNRRARTKLKQTEVDCEYLKRWCETLTEENGRLQKELQELRTLKASQSFYMQRPATTLTMCPSCERVASATAATTSSAATATTNNTALSLAKPRLLFPFTNSQSHAQQAAS